MNFRQKLGMGIAKMFNLNVLPGTEHDEDKTLEWLGIERKEKQTNRRHNIFYVFKNDVGNSRENALEILSKYGKRNQRTERYRCINLVKTQTESVHDTYNFLEHCRDEP